jgi:hypothetical protein
MSTSFCKLVNAKLRSTAQYFRQESSPSLFKNSSKTKNSTWLRTLDDTLLSEQVDVGCLNHGFLARMRDQVEVLKRLTSRRRVSSINAIVGTITTTFLNRRCASTASMTELSYACRSTEHYVPPCAIKLKTWPADDEIPCLVLHPRPCALRKLSGQKSPCC